MPRAWDRRVGTLSRRYGLPSRAARRVRCGDRLLPRSRIDSHQAGRLRAGGQRHAGAADRANVSRSRYGVRHRRQRRRGAGKHDRRCAAGLTAGGNQSIRRMKEKTERERAQTSIAENRKAYHDYHLLETFEAGVALLGTEVKAIREGRINLRDSFARVENGEVYLYNVHISPYSHRGYADHEPLRRRKLLLHKDEIRKLVGKTVEKGMTLVPVRMYFKKGRVKVAVSLAKGKKEYDKRETIKKRETDRETRAAIKSRR